VSRTTVVHNSALLACPVLTGAGALTACTGIGGALSTAASSVTVAGAKSTSESMTADRQPGYGRLARCV